MTEPDQDSNCLTLVMVFLKECFETVNFEEKKSVEFFCLFVVLCPSHKLWSCQNGQ